MILITVIAMAASQPSMSEFRPGGASMWMYRAATDEMTDRVVSSATLQAADGSASLKVKCDSAVDRVVSIQFRSARYLGSGERLVSLRFDKQPVVTVTWETADKMVYERDALQVARIIDAMAISEKLMIRAFDFQNRPVDATFAISGPASKLAWQQVLADCHYPDSVAKAPSSD